MKKVVVKADEYNKGKKRINISLGISDFEDLILISQNRGIENPGTLACSLLVQQIRHQVREYKPRELPGQQNLFDKRKRK